MQEDKDLCRLREVVREIEREGQGRLSAWFYGIRELDGDRKVLRRCLGQVRQANMTFLHIHGGSGYFRSFLAVREAMAGRPFFYWSGMEDENLEMEEKGGFLPEEYAIVSRYFQAGGSKNLKNMLRYLTCLLGGFPPDYQEPQFPRWEKILFFSEEECPEEEYLEQIDRRREDRPVVGILVHCADVREGNLRHIRALAEHLTGLGTLPLAVCTNVAADPDLGSEGLRGVIERYFQRRGYSRIDALIVTCGFSLSLLANPGDGRERLDTSVFEILDVPVIQAMTTYYTYRQWRESAQGLDPLVLNSNVYQAEYDGQLIGVPLGYTDRVPTEFGEVTASFPIPGRVERLANLARNWALLHRKPASEIRVAVILHNMPPRNDLIGCAYGLDTPASLSGMLQAMGEVGIQVGNCSQDGEEVIRKIQRGLTNERDYLPEEEMLRRCWDTVDAQRYERWFESFPAKVQQELSRDWGRAPGTFFTARAGQGGRKILVPGFGAGNLFIGLQPPRAQAEKAQEAYHSTDLVCPHQYLAFYRWVAEVFKADVLVHLGTHGTVEWLPGKGNGLSEECYPDLAVGSLPHLYPYIVNVPGEGMQAKRRTCAGIVDHLIPSMRESGLYGDLEALNDRVERWHHAKRGDPGKLPILEKEIWDLIRGLQLDKRLGLREAVFRENMESVLGEIHEWLENVRHTEIKDGLHIFGQAPQGERFLNMARLLVRMPNGNVPSLGEGIDAWCGFRPAWEREGQERQLLERLQEAGWDRSACAGLAVQVLGTAGGDGEPLVRCMEFLCGEVVPRLRRTREEMGNFLRGLTGGFLPPGPSGSPSRGQASLLPTGRNFYSIDPGSLPSRAAWKMGERLAQQLLERYHREKQELPENVTMVVYAGDTMKTCGDDLAEILWLYGVRPVWLGETEKVIGLEPIPIEELGRPRIDVTLRISGLFRDTFPNLIERIEDGVNLVASLEEDLEQNYIRKHVLGEICRLADEGKDFEQARRQALARVFGCPPGTYGAGVDTVIEGKCWEDSSDLGRVYVNWSCHAYGRELHGERLQEAFERRLAACQVTVKNIPSVESDLLDDDDYYIYHGGLISAVESLSGTSPQSYSVQAERLDAVRSYTVGEDVERIMRARILNPAWAAGLRRHGYRGASEFSQMMDIVFGWDATAKVVEDWMYEALTRMYVGAGENRKWMEAINPWALREMAERLLEAEQRGMWRASQESLELLRQTYLDMEGRIEDETDRIGL